MVTEKTRIKGKEAATSHHRTLLGGMEAFVGKWKITSGKGFDAFLKDRGVGERRRGSYRVQGRGGKGGR